MDGMGQDGIVRTMCDMATQLRGGELIARIELRVLRGALLVLCGATWLMRDVLEERFWWVDSVWQLDNVGLASGTRALASFSPCTYMLRRSLLYFIIFIYLLSLSSTGLYLHFYLSVPSSSFKPPYPFTPKFFLHGVQIMIIAKLKVDEILETSTTQNSHDCSFRCSMIFNEDRSLRRLCANPNFAGTVKSDHPCNEL